MKAMILAAGLGTRLKPFTDHHPKALAIVNHKTLLERNIQYLASYGIKEIIINVHHFADQIVDFIQLKDFKEVKIVLSDERDEVLETGGGLKKAAWFFDDLKPFVLMNVDILTDMNLGKMIAYHEHHQPLVTLAVSGRESSRCFLFDQEMNLCGWRNNSTHETKLSREATGLKAYSFSGIHIIQPEIFSMLKQEGKFSIVDSYLEIAKSKKMIGYHHSGCNLLDVGRPESIVKAEMLFS